ncbi:MULTISPECIES: hypothetical protein [Rhizobium]|nr:hypothetical protein [Rhizobium leguminosarum]MBB4506177.1 hypothetical protein [Rhizobium leguminosarum]
MTLAKPRSGGAFLFRQRKKETRHAAQAPEKLDIRPQNHEAR